MANVRKQDDASPLGDVSDDELGSLVDDVLRSGKHSIVPTPDGDRARDAHAGSERHHARVIAGQLTQLASSLSGADAQTEASARWYFEVHGKQLGPVTLSDAHKMWEDGVLSADSFCWTDGFSAWIPLSKVTELAAVLAPRVPMPERALPRAVEEEAEGWEPQASTLRDELKSKPKEPKPSSEPVAPQQSAGIYYVLPTPPAAPEPAPPPRQFSWLSQSVVTGIVAGAVMALILLLAPSGLLALRGQSAVPVAAPPVAVAPAAAPAPVVAPPVAAAPVVAPAPAPAAEVPPAPVVAKAPEAKPAPAKPAPVAGVRVAKASKPAAKPATPATEEEGDAIVVAPTSGGTPPPGEETFGDDAFDREFGTPEPKTEAAPAAPAEKKKASVYVPPPPGSASALPETLSQGQVMEVVVAHKKEIQACVEANRPADREGKLVMRWTVSAAGTTTSVRAVSPEDLTDSPLAECLGDAIASWSFPKHQVQADPFEVPFSF